MNQRFLNHPGNDSMAVLGYVEAIRESSQDVCEYLPEVGHVVSSWPTVCLSGSMWKH